MLSRMSDLAGLVSPAVALSVGNQVCGIGLASSGVVICVYYASFVVCICAGGVFLTGRWISQFPTILSIS